MKYFNFIAIMLIGSSVDYDNRRATIKVVRSDKPIEDPTKHEVIQIDVQLDGILMWRMKNRGKGGPGQRLRSDLSYTDHWFISRLNSDSYNSCPFSLCEYGGKKKLFRLMPVDVKYEAKTVTGMITKYKSLTLTPNDWERARDMTYFKADPTSEHYVFPNMKVLKPVNL